MFYGVHSMITVVVNVSHHVARLPGDSIRLSKDEQVPISELKKKNSILVHTQVYKTKENSEQMQRSSVVQSGHNLLDKAGVWDQNQNGKWLLVLQRKYKAKQRKGST